MERQVWVRADAATEARERVLVRAREAVRRYEEAERELSEAMVVVDRELGPDPRRIVAEQAIRDFCATVTGRPAIRPA